MIYVTSDLHGYPLQSFLSMLDRAGFSDQDYLFVLGDVIDRGPDGIALLRWMAQQPNVELILGNHEAMMLSCEFVFDSITEENLSKLDADKYRMAQNWLYNGASPTLDSLGKLLRNEPDVLEGILDYLRDAPLYDTVTVGGRKIILVHGGLKNFHSDKPLEDYVPMELLWARPTLADRYYSDALVIFGHTPTEFLGEEFRGKAVFTDTWICIDTGAATGNKPMLLRLDDMQVFY